MGFLPQTQFHDLRGFTPVSIDGDALQPEFPGPQIGLSHIPDRRFMGQIDCFRGRIVHMPLKGGLDLKMPLRGNFQGRHEKPFEILRNAFDFLEPALFKDFFNDLMDDYIKDLHKLSEGKPGDRKMAISHKGMLVRAMLKAVIPTKIEAAITGPTDIRLTLHPSLITKPEE